MFRHIALIVVLTAVALAAGVAMVPGEREQWTMLVRDGRNQEAIRALEMRYSAGKREVDAVLHLYKLYMSFAETDQATRLMRDFVADHPDDPAAVGLLAKHYNDIQNRTAEMHTLERLFALAPSIATARDLLAHYRLEGAFDREEGLLRTLLANQMITANDAERLGLMLASHGDLFGARDALTRFDELANPERSIGRLALFDVLVQTGDTAAALDKAAAWIGHWRKVSIHRPAGSEIPATRLIRMMMAVDETATRRLICQVQRNEVQRNEVQRNESQRSEAPARATDDTARDPCEASIPGFEGADAGGSTFTNVEPRDEFGRRRRR
jgi:Flp pilus assembly protein TadD